MSKWSNNRAIAALVRKVATYEKVKTIWQRDKYVKLTSFYYPSKVTFQASITKKILSLKDFPQTGGLVIQGTVGQGKSIFLRYLCIQELQHQSSGRIPVLVELRKLDSKTTLKSAVFETLENLGFDVNEELFDFYADSGKVVLLLDGFDELNEAQVLAVITQLESWATRYTNFQVIVTSRPGGDIQKSSYFSVCQLAPLQADDHRPFLSKIGVNGKQLDNLLLAVEQSHSQIKEFLNTPLLLTLLTMVYQSDGTIPAELPEFFQALFATVFLKHDGTKPGFKRLRHTELNDRSIELLFECFCFSVMRRDYRVSLGEDEFVTAFNDAIKFRGEKCDQTAFRHDLVKVACLLLEDGGKLNFAHKSLLEYFCASFIKHATEIQAEKIYSSIQLQPHWCPVLQYVRYIDKYKYAKFFAIPKLKQTFDAYGFAPDEIFPQHIEDVFNKIFVNCVACFSVNVAGKLIQNKVSVFNFARTLYAEKLFYTLFDAAVFINNNEYTKDEFLMKFKDITKTSEADGTVSFSLPWMKLLTQERKNKLLTAINDQVREFSQQFIDLSEYVKAEDDKASELAMFDV